MAKTEKKQELAKTDSKAVEKRINEALKNYPEIKDAINRVNAVNIIRDNVMQLDIHYGIVPGTKKLALRKPGIDVLCVAFQFNIDVDVTYDEIEGTGGHREYAGKGTVIHIPTGKVMGTGIGSCSTMEAKYRWRWEYSKTEVPKAFWKNRDHDLLGGKDFEPKKNSEGDWVIARRISNKDIADVYNTCGKMAEKRIRSQCIQNVTACSALFEQEDLTPFYTDTDMSEAQVTDPKLLDQDQLANILQLLTKTKSSLLAFLEDYLISRVEELETPNYEAACKDLESGKYVLKNLDGKPKRGEGF